MSTPDGPLEVIARAFATAGMTVELEQVDVGLPIKRLKLLLPADQYPHDTVLQMMFVNDITEAVDAVGAGEEDVVDEEVVLMSFSVVLPFKAAPGAVSDVSRVLLTVNRMLPIGAFGYSEPDGAVYFSYQLALDERDELSALVLEEIVNMIGFAVDTHAPDLETVARGETRAEAVLGKLRAAGAIPPPVGDPPAMGRPTRP